MALKIRKKQNSNDPGPKDPEKVKQALKDIEENLQYSDLLLLAKFAKTDSLEKRKALQELRSRF